MSRFSFKPYVRVADRRRRGIAAAQKLSKKTGRPLNPIDLPTRTIASTFWGKAWCDNLEAYSDYASRLPRGRSYVRNGSVIDLNISSGKVEALVQGSELYNVTIEFQALDMQRWKTFVEHHAGRVANLMDLLQGRLSKDILGEITRRGTGLFPSPEEIKLGCSCPDWASMCKHVAATLYGVGARLDLHPELFFTLRGVDVNELITAATTATLSGDMGGAGGADTATLNGADLTDIFGIEIDDTPFTAPTPPIKKPAKAPKPKAVARKAKPRS